MVITWDWGRGDGETLVKGHELPAVGRISSGESNVQRGDYSEQYHIVSFKGAESRSQVFSEHTHAHMHTRTHTHRSHLWEVRGVLINSMVVIISQCTRVSNRHAYTLDYNVIGHLLLNKPKVNIPRRLPGSMLMKAGLVIC